jgi:hypothetical protein
MTAAAYVNGAWQCYDLRNGRTKHFLGCRHLLPKSAIAHTSPTYISPLRASDGATTPVLSAPLPGPDSLVAPSEPRLGDPPRP